MACDPEGFTDLYRDYLADAWQMIAMLRDAVQQQRAEEVRAKAHRLTGSRMVLCPWAVAQCAAAREELGHTCDVQGASAMLERTQQALQQVQSELAGRLA